MAFALGLAGVYMADGFGVRSSEVWVELPTARSGNVLPVFTDTPPIFTREMNCGKDPANPKARADCLKERFFGDRDMSLYVRYGVVCDATKSDDELSICRPAEAKSERDFIWRHWRNKTRAHLTIRYIFIDGIESESHYFVEPDADGHWHLAVHAGSRPRTFIIDGQATEVPVIDDHPWTYENPRWKTATKQDGPDHLPPGTRFLQFENITGDTVSF